MEDVNVVNANMVAKERGVEVCDSAREQSDHFNNLIRIEVKGDEGFKCVSGTVFDGIRPRLVSVDSCEIEMVPAGRMLFIENRDRPGVVAAIGAILAEAGINIADFRLGRNPDRESAIALVTVDSEPGDDVLQALGELPNMLMVRYVGLANL